MDDTKRLDAMIENGWAVSGPVRESVTAPPIYIVFAGECENLASAENPRAAIDLAIASARHAA